MQFRNCTPTEAFRHFAKVTGLWLRKDRFAILLEDAVNEEPYPTVPRLPKGTLVYLLPSPEVVGVVLGLAEVDAVLGRFSMHLDQFHKLKFLEDKKAR